jgi:signal recognition particle subunit SRP54
LKRFAEALKMVKYMQKMGPKGLMKGMGGMRKGTTPF